MNRIIRPDHRAFDEWQMRQKQPGKKSMVPSKGHEPINEGLIQRTLKAPVVSLLRTLRRSAYPSTVVSENLARIALEEEVFRMQEMCKYFFKALHQPETILTYVKRGGELHGYFSVTKGKGGPVVDRPSEILEISKNPLVSMALEQRKIMLLTRDNRLYSLSHRDSSAAVVRELKTLRNYPVRDDHMIIPLVNDVVISIIGRSITFADWYQAEESALTTAAVLAAFSELDQISRRDPLTNLHNRREFDLLYDFFAREYVNSRNGYNVGLIVMDVDHFKDFNERHGHAVGDKVLTHVARTAGDTIRPGDSIIRYGGEEFAILLPDLKRKKKDKDDPPESGTIVEAGIAAERCRQAIETAFLEIGGIEHRVTISIGATTLSQAALAIANRAYGVLRAPDCVAYKGQLKEMAFRGADAVALAAAKKSGRNLTALAHAMRNDAGVWVFEPIFPKQILPPENPST
ncbi:MAG: GGDEF domain-containing protein [Candidatus Micrarchaeota archaeon]